MNKLLCILSDAMAKPLSFIIAILVTALAITVGALLNFSDVYMLVLTLALSVLAILMLFPLQYTATRDTASLHAKIDELIRALPGATPPDIPPE